MSGSVANLLSSPLSDPVASTAAAGGPSAADTSLTVSNAPIHELSLVPIDSTFNRDQLHKAARIDGPPTIKLAREGRKVTLGRNMTCKIEAGYLSRQLVSIQLQKRQGQTTGGHQQQQQQQQPPRIILTMLKGKRAANNDVTQHCVKLNGEYLDLDLGETCELKPADVLALFDDQFRYVVHMGEPEVIELLDDDSDDDDSDYDDSDDNDSDDDDSDYDDGDDDDDCTSTGKEKEVKEETAGAAAAAPATSEESDAAKESTKGVSSEPSSPSVVAEARKDVETDSFCCLCFEILVKAQTLSCGHAICRKCAADHGYDMIGAAALQSQQRSDPTSSEEVFHSAKEYHSESSSSSQRKSPICPSCKMELTSIAPSIIVDNFIWSSVIQGNYFKDVKDVKIYLSKVDWKLSEAQARHVFRNDPASLSEYMATIARPKNEDERPNKKPRSESTVDVADNPDSKPSAYAAPSNDAEDNNAAECIDLSESSQADVICID